MNRLSKLFGSKSGKGKETEQPGLKAEDVTLFVHSPTELKSAGKQVEQFGMQFTLPSGEVKSFESLPIAIGRGETNQIILADLSVSSVHAKVYFDERVGSICIEDLNSLNGISVNNLPTSKNILRDGDTIMVGDLVLTFSDTGYIYQGS